MKCAFGVEQVLEESCVHKDAFSSMEVAIFATGAIDKLKLDVMNINKL